MTRPEPSRLARSLVGILSERDETLADLRSQLATQLAVKDTQLAVKDAENAQLTLKLAQTSQVVAPVSST